MLGDEYTPEEKTRIAENFVYQIVEDIIRNNSFQEDTVLTFVYNEKEFATLFNVSSEIKRIALEERLKVEFKTFGKNLYKIEVKRLWQEGGSAAFLRVSVEITNYFSIINS